MILKCGSSGTPRRSRRLSVPAESTPPSYLIVSAEAAKRAGANVPPISASSTFRTPAQRSVIYGNQLSAPDQVSRLLKGLADAVVLIHEPSAKPEIVEILRKAFRFPRPEDAEASYKVLNIMATLDMMPDPAAWKIVQKVIARINPKVAQVELSQCWRGSRAQPRRQRLFGRSAQEVALKRPTSLRRQ